MFNLALLLQRKGAYAEAVEGLLSANVCRNA